jgi:hypothetical protein
MGTRVNGVDLDAGTSGPALSDATPAALGVAAAGVSADASRADHVHALPTGGVDTSLQAAPDTGWTADGDGAASIASGVATLSMGAAQGGVGLYREMPASPLGPALEVTARITRTVSTGDYHWFGLGLVRQTPEVGYRLLCQSDGNAVASIDTGGGVSTTGTTAFPGGATLDSGTLWARFVITPTYTAWYVGAGATRPTSWTLMHSRAANVALLASGVVAQLALLGARVTGTGTATAKVTDIQWRSLLGAPT